MPSRNQAGARAGRKGTGHGWQRKIRTGRGPTSRSRPGRRLNH
jgi:hypothetical protein